MCHIEQQIADYCNEPEEAECSECYSVMDLTKKNGYELLVCPECDFKMWLNGDEYEE